MNRERIIRRAEETARKLRQAARITQDPLHKEANKSIMALLGLLGEGQDGQI